MMYATCETVGCSNAWQPIEVAGETLVLCGVCLAPITNITDMRPDEGTVLPTWISEMLQTQNSDN